ncbi:MAG TPA: FecR domain-containing protein [Planctomycetota bacterium]|nr:FecR domain-containing protein [Planctomycetota bacterium]
MSDPRLDDLLHAFARQEATEADLRELAGRLDVDGDDARALASRIQDELLLAGWFRGEADAAFVQEAAAAAATDAEDPAFVRGTLKRLERPPTRRRTAPDPGVPWAIPVLAASVLVVLGLLLWPSPPPGTPKSRPAPVALPKVPRPPYTPVPEPSPPPPAPPPPQPLIVPTPKPPHPLPPPVKPAPEPAPAAPQPAPIPPRETLAAIAKLTQVEGQVTVTGPGVRTLGESGLDLLPGRGLEVGTGHAVLKFPDGTLLEAGAGTKLTEIADDADGKRLLMEVGTLTATVAKQPAGKPLLVLTPHVEARVLGTTLRLVVDKATRLEVTEGRVRLTRMADKKAVDVAAGHFTVSSGDLVPRSIEAFTLKDIPAQGLALWLRADAGVTVLDGAVATWSDQSGNRRDATQAAAGSRPKILLDAVRGRPALRFDGIDDALMSPLSIEGLGGLTLILVAANATDFTGGKTHGENAALFWPETVDWGWVYLSPFQSNVKWRFGTTQTNNLPFHIRAANAVGFTMTTVLKDGAAETLYIQGAPVERVTGKLPAVKGTQPSLQIGMGANATGFPGDIAEILIYARALSDAERQRVERALSGKYSGNR